MRPTFLPFALPDTDQTEIEAVAEAIRSGWVTTGPKTRQFEAGFAAAVGAQHGVAVNSCTAAMHLALEAIGLQAGHAVITTPYTFAATAEVIRYFNATPVFVDVDPDTLNIDPAQLDQLTINNEQLTKDAANGRRRVTHNSSAGATHNSQLTTHNLKAIIPVHIAGLPAELDAINAIAARHRLAVIEDAAHAFPAAYKGRMIGSALAAPPTPHSNGAVSGPPAPSPLPHTPYSQTPAIDNSTFNIQHSTFPLPHAICFSFYATKTITTGEGGMLCTDDEALAERCRVMALHGISKDAWKRYTAEGSWYYEIIAPGFKYNMTDIAAAMGLAQLAKAERMAQRRRDIARQYNAAFGDMPELQLPADRADCRHAWHLYVLRLNLARLTIDRGEFIAELKQRNIGVSVHFIPLHLHPYYRDTYGYQPHDFPVAFGEYQRVISLPIYSKMRDEDVTDVIRAVRAVVKQYQKTKVLGVGSRGVG
jgi:dTDP-4-amino-4,6-dideoxygalactose transaminase